MNTATDIYEFLEQDEKKDLLRFLTAGSVDDGKSTLIGRLLFDSKKIYEDQLDSLIRDSNRIGKAGDKIDYALLTDGLKAEREQGITIDVAYRFFSTNSRKFIIADTPGHERYTRNMITGGSTADLAIILVDATKGVIQQTRRHTFLVSVLCIKKIVLAVNKMDLVDYSREVFDGIVRDYKTYIECFAFPSVIYIPMSALNGDNVVDISPLTPWYNGPSLLDFLETVTIANDINTTCMRLLDWTQTTRDGSKTGSYDPFTAVKNGDMGLLHTVSSPNALVGGSGHDVMLKEVISKSDNSKYGPESFKATYWDPLEGVLKTGTLKRVKYKTYMPTGTQKVDSPQK